MAAFLPFFAVLAPVARAGFALPLGVVQPTSSDAATTLQASVERAKTFLEDAWVDTQISAPTPSPCRSLNECGWKRADWNRSIGTYADMLDSKRPLAFTHVEQTRPEQRTILEASAVQLSLLLERSCTELGPRQCWRRSSGAAEGPAPSGAKELRPVTITFGESNGSRDIRSSPSAARAPLVASLKHFRLTSA